MKWSKNGNLPKLVAFFGIAMVLTCTVVYATAGLSWHTDSDSGNNGKTEDELSNGEFDTNNDFIQAIKPIPEYLHYITGLETTAEESFRKPICITSNAASPIFGISSSYLVFEIPIENEQTRFLSYYDQNALAGKIGALSPTRGSISNLVSYFGGILIANGNDGYINTESSLHDNDYIDISQNNGYYYTEKDSDSYTNNYLIDALINNTKTSIIKTQSKDIPFIHNGYYDEKITGSKSAKYAGLFYSHTNTTELIYSDTSDKYTLYKNGSILTDFSNNQKCEYDNVFILYANSVTYETAEYTESIVDTTSGGSGLYLTNGTLTEIRWKVSDDGSLVFFGQSGEKLVANRGSTYISLFKSTDVKNTIIE